MSDIKEREQFERWYEANAMPCEADWFRKDKDFPDMYDSYGTESAWEGWQAGRAPLLQTIEAKELKIAELQRLCERAWLEIDENYTKLLDPNGYGPQSLVRHLEKAAKGGELKDVSIGLDILSRSNKELTTKLKRYKEVVEAARLVITGYIPEKLMDDDQFVSEWDAAHKALAALEGE